MTEGLLKKNMQGCRIVKARSATQESSKCGQGLSAGSNRMRRCRPGIRELHFVQAVFVDQNNFKFRSNAMNE